MNYTILCGMIYTCPASSNTVPPDQLCYRFNNTERRTYCAFRLSEILWTWKLCIRCRV